MKNKLIIYIDEIKYSGAAKIATWLANKISDFDFEVIFVTYKDSDIKKLNDRIRYSCLMCYNKNKYIRSINTIIKLRRLLKREKPTIAISFLPFECLCMLIARIGLRIPVIITERSDPYLEKSIIASISRYCYRFADGAVFQTKEAKDYFPEKLKEKSIVIENPAFKPKNQIIPYEERKESICCVSRLDIRQKRLDILIKAFDIINKENKDVTLNIYGDGKSENIIRELINKHNLENQVVLHGRVDNVISKISDSKVLILTSDFEGIPNAVLEALSIGVPVVSTDYSPGGIRNLIEDGKNGYVVKRGDYVAIAEKVNEILNNDLLGRTMSENARSILTTYSENYIILKWYQYCFDVINIYKNNHEK